MKNINGRFKLKLLETSRDKLPNFEILGFELKNP
jgi:hypothetical protein